MWCCYMACSSFAGLTNLAAFRQRTITVRNHSHNYRMRAALTPWTSHLIRAYTRAWRVWEKAASHRRRRVLHPRPSPRISRRVLRGTHSKGNLLHRATPFRGERPLRAPGELPAALSAPTFTPQVPPHPRQQGGCQAGPKPSHKARRSARTAAGFNFYSEALEKRSQTRSPRTWRGTGVTRFSRGHERAPGRLPRPHPHLRVAVTRRRAGRAQRTPTPH